MTNRAATLSLLLCLVAPGCQDQTGTPSRTPRSTPAPTPASPPATADGGTAQRADAAFADERNALVRRLAAKGIEDRRVLDALRGIPRHELVPKPLWGQAYVDDPLPIGQGQTISQPYIVALMTELAEVQPGEKALEIGTGSGYQAAVLAELAGEVYTIEIVESLAKRARRDLERLGLADDIHFRIGDGYAGWPEQAPFDAIVVTAAPAEVPEPLKEQLAVGGRLVIPVGETFQELMVIERTADGYGKRKVIPVRFVPMTGKARDG